MKIRRLNQQDFVLICIFLAVFRPEFLPTPVKLGLLGIAYVYILGYAVRVRTNILANNALFYCIPVFVSLVVNFSSGLSNFSNTFYGINYLMNIYALFTFYCIAKFENRIENCLKTTRNILATYCIVSIPSIITQYIHGGDHNYLMGSKFMVGYYLIAFYILFHLTTKDSRLNRILKIGLGALIFVLMIFMQSFTIIFSYIFLLAFLYIFRKSSAKLSSSKILIISMVAAVVVSFAFDYIITNSQFLNTFIYTILGKRLTFLGRIRIYETLKTLIANRPIWGYGYNNNVFINSSLTWAQNAQNGMLEITLNYGVISTIGFLITTFKSTNKQAKSNFTIAMFLILYTLVIASTVEISYNYVLFLILALLTVSDEDGINQSMYIEL